MENIESHNKQKKSTLILILIIAVILISVIIYFVTSNDDGETTTNTSTTTNEATTNDTAINDAVTNTNTANTSNTNTTDENIISLIKFESVSSDWYEHVWFKSADANGEVSYSNDGATFTSPAESNTRAGIMTDVEKDVSEYSELNLHLTTTNTKQTLTGTGWNGREAPVAVAVSYTDADGLLHASLGLDPTAAGQMFWHGFYTLDPEGNSGTINGTKVVSGEKFTFDFDLMSLDPKPRTIHYVGLEGAGWPERQGTIHELSLIGIK